MTIEETAEETVGIGGSRSHVGDRMSLVHETSARRFRFVYAYYVFTTRTR